MVLTIILNKKVPYVRPGPAGPEHGKTADEVRFVGGFMEFSVTDVPIDSLSWIRLPGVVRSGIVRRGSGVRF